MRHNDQYVDYPQPADTPNTEVSAPADRGAPRKAEDFDEWAAPGGTHLRAIDEAKARIRYVEPDAAGLHDMMPYPERGTFAEVRMLYCRRCGTTVTVAAGYPEPPLPPCLGAPHGG